MCVLENQISSRGMPVTVLVRLAHEAIGPSCLSVYVLLNISVALVWTKGTVALDCHPSMRVVIKIQATFEHHFWLCSILLNCLVACVIHWLWCFSELFTLVDSESNQSLSYCSVMSDHTWHLHSSNKMHFAGKPRKCAMHPYLKLIRDFDWGPQLEEGKKDWKADWTGVSVTLTPTGNTRLQFISMKFWARKTPLLHLIWLSESVLNYK